MTTTQSMDPLADHASIPDRPTGGQGQSQNQARERTVVRLHPDTKQRVGYWSKRRGFDSANEYIVEAIEEKIRRENLDYDLPTLEIARLNQVVDEMKANSTNLANLERVVTQGFDSLIGLTRGDNNYLSDDEDGELSE